MGPELAQFFITLLRSKFFFINWIIINWISNNNDVNHDDYPIMISNIIQYDYPMNHFNPMNHGIILSYEYPMNIL